MNKTIGAHLKILLATILIGSSFIVSKRIANDISSISVTLLRFVIASILLMPIVIFKKENRAKIKPTFFRAMIVSLFYSLFFIIFFTSLKYTTAVNTGTLYTLVPLLTALLSIFIFKQKLPIQQFAIYCIGIISSLIVISKGNIDTFLHMELNNGDFLYLFAILSMSLYAISMKFLHKKGDSLLVFVFLTMIGGVIYLSLATVIMNVSLNWNKLNSSLLLNILYLSTVTTLLTSYLNQSATVILGPKKVMSYIYLNPALIVGLQFLLERKTVNLWTNIGIIISSIATLILLKRDGVKKNG